MIKTYTIKLYPNKQQIKSIIKHINACRYIWNIMIEKQEQNYNIGNRYLTAFSMSKLLTSLKKDDEHFWLNEVSTTSCQIICKDLDRAYQSFFKGKSNRPKYKSKKKSKLSFPVRNDRLRIISKKKIHIPNIGHMKCRIDDRLIIGDNYKFFNARVKNRNGKWILTVGIESENQTFLLTNKNMGIDLGIKDSAIVAYGDEKLVFPNINKSRKIRLIEQKIKYLQRTTSRKYEANKIGKKFIKTKNIERCEKQLNRLYARLLNIRKNYIHQSTHKLISLFPNRVVMENLNIIGMMKNKHLAKAIQEQCFYEWIWQMKYKCKSKGIEFVQADRFYPSSKTCSRCGCIKHDLRLSDRTFICSECGLEIDRDYQAALNLMRYET